MSASPVVMSDRCTYTDKFRELFTAELILIKEEEEMAKSGSNLFEKRQTKINHCNALYQKFIDISGFIIFSRSSAAPKDIVLQKITKYWTKYRVQSRKEVPKYCGISFPDFEHNDVKNTSEMKAIISRMPLLVPDVCCFKYKITGTATRKSIYNSMRGEDVKKHRNGATSNVNGVIFSNLHPKIDACIVKVKDYPVHWDLFLCPLH